MAFGLGGAACGGGGLDDGVGFYAGVRRGKRRGGEREEGERDEWECTHSLSGGRGGGCRRMLRGELGAVCRGCWDRCGVG